MNAKRAEFEEIGHSGGKVTVIIGETERGLTHSMGYSISNPVPCRLVTLYALPQGIPIERINTAGMGVEFPPPSVPGSYVVMLASDREGHFGRTCQFCKKYWRASDAAQAKSGYCAYCGQMPTSLFMTDRQRIYVQSVCSVISHGLNQGPGEYVWDLDELGHDSKDINARAFYLADERQQTHSLCHACGFGQDVLGRASYCCACGTRNDRVFLISDLDNAKQRARDGALEGALRDTVSATDSFISMVVKQLVERVPLSAARKAYWGGNNRPRHKFEEAVRRFDADFGFKIAASLKPKELELAKIMFARRHLHEHGGGIVDQTYLDETGDPLRLGQTLKEDSESVFGLIGAISKASAALMEGFHELFPPSESAIAMGEKYGRVERARKWYPESSQK